MMNVLAVAPRVQDLPALASDRELAEIGDTPGVRIEPITDVTRERIVDRLSRGKYDALLWIGHGEPAALILADGERVDPQWLASQLAGRVGLAVLAVCSSADVAESGSAFSEMLPAYGIDTIAWVGADVSDVGARRYSIGLFQALANSAALRRAHEIGRARLEPSQRNGPKLFPRDGQTSSPHYEVARDARMNETALRSVDGRLERMNDVINDMRAEQAAIRATQEAMQRELGELKTEVHLLRSGVAFPRAYIAASGLAMLVFFVLLMVVTWRVL